MKLANIAKKRENLHATIFYSNFYFPEYGYFWKSFKNFDFFLIFHKNLVHIVWIVFKVTEKIVLIKKLLLLCPRKIIENHLFFYELYHFCYELYHFWRTFWILNCENDLKLKMMTWWWMMIRARDDENTDFKPGTWIWTKIFQ